MKDTPQEPDGGAEGDPSGAQDLLPRELIKEFHRRRGPARAICRVMFNLAVTGSLYALIVLYADTPVIAIAAALGVGLMQSGWYEALHWSAHRSIFVSKEASRALGHLSAFLCLWPYSHFRGFHMDHHRYTGNAERDPELLVGSPTECPPTFFARVGYIAITGVIFPCIQLLLMFRMLMGGSADHRHATPWLTKAAYEQLVVECRLLFLVYGGIIGALAATVPVALIYVPLVAWATYAWLAFFALPEHVGLQKFGDYDSNGRPSATSQTNITRYFESNPVVRYIRWNENSHALHHAFPSAPYYAMRKISHQIKHKLPHRRKSYVGFLLNGDAHPEKRLANRQSQQ